jgi:type IV secretory pathway TraG/TraD family ATPase VirD4
LRHLRPGQQPRVFKLAVLLAALFEAHGFRAPNGTNGRLPVLVNVCLEEFCNIGKLVDFKKVLSVCRSRGIHCQIIVQSISQLSDRYEKKEWEELIGNADIQICLGCNDQMTAQYISDKCGMATIGSKQSDAAHAAVFTRLHQHAPLFPDPLQHPAPAHDAGRVLRAG